MELRSGIIASVSLITYNQKNYISEAIESVIKQKTNFPYELIIGDDCSTDGTRDILLKYQENFPEQIRLILHPEKNKGIPGKLNFIATLRAASGKFLALLDGDDYWTSSNKLQKQVDFLRNNPEYAICCHDVWHRKKNKNYRSREDIPVDSDLSYLLRRGNFISSPSVVYRNGPDLADFMEKFPRAPFGDYLMHVSAARRGKIKFMEERMAVHRIHDGGVWSKLGFEESFLKTIAELEMLFDFFPEEKIREDLRIQLLCILDEVLWLKEFQSMITHPVVKNILDKMGIPEYLKEYLKFSVGERAGRSYLSRNIPVPVLAKALTLRLARKTILR